MGVGGEFQKKIGGRWGPDPLGYGRGWPPINTLLPTLCNAKIDGSNSTRVHGYGDLPENRLLRSLKVIGTDTARSATYDFLLGIHSKLGRSRTVSEINCDFGRNLQIFPFRVYLTPLW